MPRLTREEAKALGRRAQQPTRAPGELLAVWVSGKLVNPLNAAQWWVNKVHPRYKREWHERVALALLEGGWSTRPGETRLWPHRATERKRVSLLASVAKKFDDEGLRAALKAVMDELVKCQVIHDDGPDSGHQLVYTQVIDRARRGVEVRVSLRKDGA